MREREGKKIIKQIYEIKCNPDSERTVTALIHTAYLFASGTEEKRHISIFQMQLQT